MHAVIQAPVNPVSVCAPETHHRQTHRRGCRTKRTGGSMLPPTYLVYISCCALHNKLAEVLAVVLHCATDLQQHSAYVTTYTFYLALPGNVGVCPIVPACRKGYAAVGKTGERQHWPIGWHKAL